MKKIVFVYGGNGSEREVSLMSKNSILEVLNKISNNVVEYDFDENAIDFLRKHKDSIVFNGMYGKWGEDGVLPTICDFLKIPYTHSGRLASSIAINKDLTKQIAKRYGNVCESFIVSKDDILKNRLDFFPKSFVKPVSQGSSRGSFIFESGKNNIPFEEISSCDDGFFLVEEFFDGVDFNVGVFGEGVIGHVEILPSGEFYDFDSKYSGKSSYVVNSEIDPKIVSQIYDMTLQIHRAIGARFISRSDFLLNKQTGDWRFLEINTHPGLTAHSLITKMYSDRGGTYEKLIFELLQNATYEEYRGRKSYSS